MTGKTMEGESASHQYTSSLKRTIRAKIHAAAADVPLMSDSGMDFDLAVLRDAIIARIGVGERKHTPSGGPTNDDDDDFKEEMDDFFATGSN